MEAVVAEELKSSGGREPMHRYALRVPESLWHRIDEMHWTQRKSINRILVDAIRRGLGEKHDA